MHKQKKKKKKGINSYKQAILNFYGKDGWRECGEEGTEIDIS